MVGTERVDGLTGTAVGARVGFSGRVRVRRPRLAASERPATKEPEVLLTPTLDPAVVGEFPHTVGCVTNVGGQLSHAAIVAREMGYPVVCLPGCTETLRDGDYVEVTPAGQVTIDRPATSAGTGTWQAQKATG